MSRFFLREPEEISEDISEFGKISKSRHMVVEVQMVSELLITARGLSSASARALMRSSATAIAFLMVERSYGEDKDGEEEE